MVPKPNLFSRSVSRRGADVIATRPFMIDGRNSVIAYTGGWTLARLLLGETFANPG